MPKQYEVTVGNIGKVYSGGDAERAAWEFLEYSLRSEHGEGRAAGEEVVLWEDGEPIKEHFVEVTN